MESDLDRKYCCHGAGDWGGWERRGNDAKVKECSAAHLQGSESWKKAPFESDKKVGENRKYFVRNISRLSQTRKKKTLPQHSLPARNTLEIKKKNPHLVKKSRRTPAAWLAVAQLWHWSFAVNVSKAWCYAVPGFAQMTRKYSKLHSLIADLSTPCTQSMQLQL